MEFKIPNNNYTDDELSMIKDRMSNCLDKFIMQPNSQEVRNNIEEDIMNNINNTHSDIISNRRDIKIDEILDVLLK